MKWYVQTRQTTAYPPLKHVQFVDFARYSEWSPRHIKSIERPAGKTIIEPGDKLKVTLEGTSFSPVVLENSESSFKWLGSLPYIFSGTHSFLFQPSKETPGHTTFVDNEDFSGLLSFLMLSPLMGAGTKANFEKFNEDLKKRVESLR